MALRLPQVSLVASNDTGNNIQGEFNTLSLGLSFHRAWTYLTIFNTTAVFSSPVIIASDEPSMHLTLFYLVAALLSTLLLFGAAAFCDAARTVLLRERTVYAAGALCTFGTVLLLIGESLTGLALPIAIVSALICALGHATLIMLWGMAYARFDTMTTVINTSISIFFALLLFAVLSYCLPHTIGCMLTALLPLAEMPFISKWVYAHSRSGADLPRPSNLPAYKGRLAARLGIPVFLFGISLGMLRFATTHLLRPDDDLLVFIFAVLGAGIIVFLLLVLLYMFSEQQAEESPIRYMMPLLVLSLVFLPVPAFNDAPLLSSLILTSYFSYKAVMWIFFADTCRRFRLSPIFVFGIGFGSMSAGMILSNFILLNERFLDSISPFGNHAMFAFSIIAMVIAYALLPHTSDIARFAHPESKKRARNEAPRTRTIAGQSSPSHEFPSDSPSKTIPAPSNRSAANEQTEFEEASNASFSAENEIPLSAPPTKAAGNLTQSAEQHVETSREAPPNSADAFRKRCEEISNAHLLSRRESEVLYLLARGHNASYIQEKLCVAQSTTKTHIYHIYQKLNIHTQQELIAMIAGDD